MHDAGKLFADPCRKDRETESKDVAMTKVQILVNQIHKLATREGKEIEFKYNHIITRSETGNKIRTIIKR